MIKRHVLLTGEIGAGKSTVLRRTLALLDVRAGGIETYSPEPRGVLPKRLFLRAYGSEETGAYLCTLPQGDRGAVLHGFNETASVLLAQAQKSAELIVIDEIGRLEREALAYHEALRACLDGSRPVLGVIRRHKADWADWIRAREDVLLLEVTEENRSALAEVAAERIRASLMRLPGCRSYCG